MLTLEVPMYAAPLDELAALREREGLAIILYGGFPDSPLNGGRTNIGLDGLSSRSDAVPTGSSASIK
jgi:hypothetical protein